MIEIKYDNKDFLAIILFSFVLALMLLEIFGINSVSYVVTGNKSTIFINGVSYSNPQLLLAVLFTAVVFTIFLHELIHIFCLKMLGVKFRVKTISLVAIQIDYNEMLLHQYYLTALSPQILTLAFLTLTAFVDEFLKPLLVILVVFHLSASAGDIYGVLKTFLKVGCQKGKIVRVENLRYVVEIDKRFK